MTSSLSRRAALALLGAAALMPAIAVPAAEVSHAEILTAMRDGGHVVYFRHGKTTHPGVDKISWPRHRQRLLSDAGIAQSEMIGEAFRTAGLPVGQVVASPFARCRDMAEIAFGRVEEERLLLGLLSDASGRDERVRYLRERMSSVPSAGKNRVIVSHTSNIREVAGVNLGEGDAVVVRPDGKGGFTILSILTPQQWREAADAPAG